MSSMQIGMDYRDFQLNDYDEYISPNFEYDLKMNSYPNDNFKIIVYETPLETTNHNSVMTFSR